MTKSISLISSGIDSPVASHIMIGKGLEIIGVHMKTLPEDSDVVERLCKKIGIKKLYKIPYMDIQKEFIDNCTNKFVCILCKRLMLRIAQAIAEKEKAKFIVTGENLAQVASQTLDNMAVLSNAVTTPILRPILCNDKQETIDIAKKIGTYEASIEIGKCCNAVPKLPATKSTIKAIQQEEKKIDINKIIENAINSAEVIEL